MDTGEISMEGADGWFHKFSYTENFHSNDVTAINVYKKEVGVIEVMEFIYDLRQCASFGISKGKMIAPSFSKDAQRISYTSGTDPVPHKIYIEYVKEEQANLK